MQELRGREGEVSVTNGAACVQDADTNSESHTKSLKRCLKFKNESYLPARFRRNVSDLDSNQAFS